MYDTGNGAVRLTEGFGGGLHVECSVDGAAVLIVKYFRQ